MYTHKYLYRVLHPLGALPEGAVFLVCGARRRGPTRLPRTGERCSSLRQANVILYHIISYHIMSCHVILWCVLYHTLYVYYMHNVYICIYIYTHKYVYEDRRKVRATDGAETLSAPGRLWHM